MTKENYQELINYLFRVRDLEYSKFHKKLLNNDDIIVIGIRTPELRKIAKIIAKNDYIGFIKLNKHKYYEEVLLHGLVIGYSKTNFEEKVNLLDSFLPYNNNWAVNDLVCNTLKIFIKKQKEGYNLILKYLESDNPWIVRFGLVLLLCYYVNDEYIELVIDCIKNIKSDEYYVRMANAWLISICYIKYPLKTLELFINNDLDTFTNNKAISKIRDSYRVSTYDKNSLLKYKK